MAPAAGRVLAALLWFLATRRVNCDRARSGGNTCRLGAAVMATGARKRQKQTQVGRAMRDGWERTGGDGVGEGFGGGGARAAGRGSSGWDQARAAGGNAVAGEAYWLSHPAIRAPSLPAATISSGGRLSSRDRRDGVPGTPHCGRQLLSERCSSVVERLAAAIMPNPEAQLFWGDLVQQVRTAPLGPGGMELGLHASGGSVLDFPKSTSTTSISFTTPHRQSALRTTVSIPPMIPRSL